MNRPLTMTAEQIKYMRDRFLNWTLPKDLNPDGGISFKRSESAIKYNHPMPVGTNFLDAAQAEEMVRYMIDGLPELDATRAALDASEQTIRDRMWDENSIQCGNCSAQIMARGGSLKSNGLSQSDGEDEKLCGHCAGLQLRDSEQTIQQLRAMADKLAEALTKEAVKRCRLCSNYNGPGAYRHVYEHVPTRGTDGRFFHQRHDGVTDGAWLCESQDIQAALAQYAEMKLASSGGLPTDTGASQGGRE